MQRLRDERGSMLIFAGLGLAAFMSATMLALDVGMYMVARTQAQAAADAGALAGAVALVYNDFDNRTAGGPAVQNAMAAAMSSANAVMKTSVSVLPADVTFPQIDRIRVRVERSSARGNPIMPFIAPMIGIDEVDLGAIATAEVIPANAATCLKPWAVPDKWDEEQTPEWDEDDTFERYYQNGPKKGQVIHPKPDIYVPITDENKYTGFRQNPLGSDWGRRIVLKPGNPHDAINASHFFPLALPGATGSDWYEENIPGCWPGVAEIGQMIDVEPGNMTGKTTAGTQALIDKDPAAYWDNTKGVVSQFHPSPRIIVIPVFDPDVYDAGREHGRLDIQVANFVGFFIEDLQGNSVIGRIVPMTGLLRGNAPKGAFLKVIRLVE
jgi:hypothetical protein